MTANISKELHTSSGYMGGREVVLRFHYFEAYLTMGGIYRRFKLLHLLC